jgi:predicted RNase H-like nuclease
MRVLGLDGARLGWVVVELVDGRSGQVRVTKTVQEALAAFPDAAAVGIDIPIGLPLEGRRKADVEAQQFVGLRRSSVFLTPPRTVLEAPTYPEANSRARQLTGLGLSRQAYGLRDKILEVDQFALTNSRIIEIHPEVSFRHLAGPALSASKHTWAGFWARLGLLRGVGIDVPVELGGAGIAGLDDVLDAAVAAYSAARYAQGQARSLPEPPEVGEAGRSVAIWY